MAGIPIFAGFFAKMVLFNQTIQAGYIALVIVASEFDYKRRILL
jgi:NADH-quinone oxidoreductase subunit N